MTRGLRLILPLLLLASPWARAQDLGKSAYQELSAAFERAGRRPPRSDPALEAAARALAGAVLNHGAQVAGNPRQVSSEVSLAGASDPHPRALLVRASSSESALKELLRHPGLTGEAATHVGVATAHEGRSTALVALFSLRQARLEPFPRQLAKAGNQRLCGRLEEGLSHAEVVVTRPAGNVERVATDRARPRDFCATLRFDAEGTHSVEVMARGERGPLVAALFQVELGARSLALAGAELDATEPTDPAVASLQIVARINALRKVQGAPPLTEDLHLQRLAQAYSDRMASEGFFAHVSPDGKTLRARLKEDGYVFVQAGENLGAAEGPLAAHRSIEDSPAHRDNLLRPDFNRVGIGLAVRPRPGGGSEVVLTELFAWVRQGTDSQRIDPSLRAIRRPEPHERPVDAYALINERRRNAKVPELARNPLLEQLAKEHAARALEQQAPSAELEGVELHQRVFTALPGAGKIAIDVYLSDDPRELPASANTTHRSWKQVGVGMVRGPSRRYGRDLAWVVVVYAAGG